MGSGKCCNTSMNGPFCGACGCHCEIRIEDFGIGSYEYWGFKGVHKDLRVISKCCEEEVFNDVNLSEYMTVEEAKNEFEMERDYEDYNGYV
jgi:hypothetical protein